MIEEVEAMSYSNRRMGFAALVLAALWIGFGAAPAPAAEGDAAQRLTAAYQARDWSATEAAALELLRTAPGNAQAHYLLAVAWMHRDRSEEALEQLDQAATAGFTPGAVEFRRACADTVLGRRDAAFAALESAVAAGFSQRALLDGEPLLDPLRGDPRYAEVLASIEKARHPCRNDPRYRQFDFWLGNWDVRQTGAAQTVSPSENVITSEHDGCVLVEHWKGTDGMTGSSFNIFDASRGEWYQTWVDSQGGLHEYHGRPDADGNMIFEGTTPGGPGQPARLPTRLSFFRLGPDEVRQFSQSSTDGGKSWSVNYDLTYLRRRGTGVS
jgi:tetratricopeptide (TPR) repeat protein